MEKNVSALSKKPDDLIRQEREALRAEDRLSPDLVFRDPYFIDLPGLKGMYAEKDLEAAILREMEAFILELGVGFAFVERQTRMEVDDASSMSRAGMCARSSPVFPKPGYWD